MHSKRKPSREWEIKDMDHRDAALREVLIITLEKFLKDGEPVIFTTDEINAEVIRRGLRDEDKLKGKVKGALIGAYRKRESMSNLNPPLFIPIEKGKYQFNNHYIEKVKLFCDRYKAVEHPTISQPLSRIDRVEKQLISLQQGINSLKGKIGFITEQVEKILAEESTQLFFVHTSPNYLGSVYEAKITSIKETISEMLQRAKDSIRISTLRIDIFADELIGLKQKNPKLEITVLTRGKQNATGERKGIKQRAIDRMAKTGIRMLVEKELLHSRIVIIDDKEVLVSSADLDVTQMDMEFNAGIWTNDQGVVAEAIRYFDNILNC